MQGRPSGAQRASFVTANTRDATQSRVTAHAAFRLALATVVSALILGIAGISTATASPLGGPSALIAPPDSLTSGVALATGRPPRVVVVVGPVGSSTSRYVSMGKQLAARARSYGATVVEIYSPNATWSRVRSALAGANALIYLGHGNGTPSPYAGGADRHNGLGLNASASGSDSNNRYYGETYIARYIRMAPNAVVILNHLCYASGNNEWGQGNPTRSVAVERVDNYGAGFLQTGAAAVFAEGITDPGYILERLFHGSGTMADIFRSSPTATNRYAISFASKRTAGATALMDPYEPNRYYRSVIGRLSVTADDWR